MKGCILQALFTCFWWCSAPLVWGQCGSTITNFPYSEGFEDSPAWTAGGTGSDWAWGTPAHPLIGSAPQGSMAWCVGGLTGSFYNYGQQSWLESPCFDLSSLEYPWISFKLFWEVEQQYDGLGFQYSLDQGASWSNVGSASFTPDCLNQNWFNTSFVNALNLASPKQGWTGRVGATVGNCAGGNGSGQWVEASHCLTDLAGETSVKFRFVFGAGTVCNEYDGIGLDDIHLGEAPPNNASFSFGCQGNTVYFENNSALCPSSFLWEFDDPASGAANTSTAEAPAHDFSGPGTYQVSLTVAGPCNATSTIVIPVTLGELEFQTVAPDCTGNNGSITAIVPGATGALQYTWSPTAPDAATISGLAPGEYSVVVEGDDICPMQGSVTLTALDGDLGFTMQHTDISCAGYADGTASFSVSGGTGPYDHSWSPELSVEQELTDLPAGSYSVTVTDALGCTATGTVVIDEPAALELVAPETLSLCAGEAVQLQPDASGGTAPYEFTYSPAGPEVSPLSTTTYTVEVTDANGCTSEPVEIIVQVGGPEAPVITVADPEGCTPHCTVISASGSGSFNWGWGDSGTAEGPSIQECFEAGSYDVTVEITDGYGCTSVTTMAEAVLVHPTPVAAFVADPPVTTIGQPEIQFIPDVTGATQLWWYFDDPEGTTSEEHAPVFAYPQVDCYRPELTVSNDQGCGSSATLEICIEDDLAIYVPNAFTPNGDGINDVLQVITTVRTPGFFQLQIFDRWGQVIYSIDAQEEGWNGSAGGREQPAGIYVWVLRMRDTLGALQERQGHITLVR